MTFVHQIFFYFFYSVIYVFSLLPLSVLYVFSDGLFLLIYNFIPYRRKVVRDNLENSFPGKSPDEIRKLEHAFYSHFCDLIVEIIKAFSMSEKEWESRVEFSSPDLSGIFHSAEKKGGLMIGSHYANFEWMVQALGRELTKVNVVSYGVYASFSNQVFERIIMKMRKRHFFGFFPMRRAMYESLKRISEEVCLFGFLADQSPGRLPSLYYTSFLGRPTAFHTSVAKIALRANSPLFFADMRKIRRGYYRLELIPIDVLACMQEQEAIDCVTDRYVKLLEQAILDKPAYWLWSHRRWKHLPRQGDRFSSSLKGNLAQPG